MDSTQVLIKARRLVAKKWIQGRSYDGAGGYCVIGAIHFSGATDCSGGCEAFSKAAGITPFNMANWNDNPARTKAQVLAAFDKAIGPRRRFLAWITGLFGVRQ